MSVRQDLLAYTLCSKWGLSCDDGTRIVTAQQSRQGPIFWMEQDGKTWVEPVCGKNIFLLSPRSTHLPYLTLPIQIVQPLAWSCKAKEFLIPDIQLLPFQFWSRSQKSKLWLVRMQVMMMKASRTNRRARSVSRTLVVHWFIPVTITNYRRQGGFNHKNVLSHSCGVWNSKSKVSAELISPESCLLGLHMAIFPLSSNDLSSVWICVLVSYFLLVSYFCKHNSLIRLGPTVWANLPSFLPQGPYL